MNLRTKVLLPLVFFNILLMGYLYGYWMPRSLADIRAEYQSSTERHLDSVSEGLIPLLLGHQLDTIYENLDALRHKNLDWTSIEFNDAHGRSLYPLTGISRPETLAPTSEVHALQKHIVYFGMDLGTLTVKVDFAPHLSQIEAQHRKLALAMFVMLTAFLLSAWFVLERLVVRPVRALSKAAADLAENRFDVALEKTGDDEVGQLVDSFAEMRNAIQGYQTALLQRSQVLKKSEEGLAEAQRMAHLGSWELDCAKKKMTCSNEVYRIFGVEVGTAGINPDVLLNAAHPDDREQVAAVRTRLSQNYSAYDVVYRIFRKSDRDIRYIHEKCEPIRDNGGSLLCFRGTIHDITEIKQAEEDLRQYKDQLEDTVQQRTAELLLARDEAQAANKAKSVFLANMSHELRTPLNAILGFSNMMRRDAEASDKQRANLDIINRSGEHLLTLINDVLEMAKIEAGRLQLEIAPFDLGGMVREVADMMHQRAQEKGLRLLLDQTSEFPRYIEGDEARLRQILLNLVSNAVKFTQQGGITIRLGVRHEDQLHLLIEVEDSGPGIAPEDQKRLFEPFVQLAEGAAQRGTGLGLSITRQFVQLMGGSIVIDSTPGKGSLFRVDLPVKPASTADVLKSDSKQYDNVAGMAPGQPDYRILITEDQPENQQLLKQLMNDIGLEAKIAENGEQCVKLFMDWHPDLIWMDRRMPVMDGIEATQRVRHLPGGNAVKIVAVTASAFKEQQQEMFDAGMNDFIRKPYRFDEIYDCLARQLGVKYIYKTNTTEQVASVALKPAMLTVLPVELREELGAALESLDEDSIKTAIGKVGKMDAQLGRMLTRVAEDFDYPSILRALNEAAITKDNPA